MSTKDITELIIKLGFYMESEREYKLGKLGI
jgi:hypothetical protein